jgi:MFS family permease
MAGVLQGGGYAVWTVFPHFTGFAAGFVLWGVGGALFTGSMEALLYDGLRALDAQRHYPTVWGAVTATGMLAQLPAALAATVLFAEGGFRLVGWVSVAGCTVAGLLALRLPEAPHGPAPTQTHEPAEDTEADQDQVAPPVGGYVATLRAGIREAIGLPSVRVAILAVALLVGFDGLEEYFPLLATDWGIPTGAVPLAVVGIPLLGAAGAALGGAANRWPAAVLGGLLAVAFALFGIAGLLHVPAGVAAIAVGYGLYRLIEVVASGRLQERIDGARRATITSVAGLGADLGAIALYAVWPLGRLTTVAVLGLLVAVALPRWLRPPTPPRRH